MIKSFRDKYTKELFLDRRCKALPATIWASASRKLRMIDATQRLDELGRLPGNHLEALKDDRVGQHSIRINDQWRICFVWRDNAAHDVEVVDYH